MKRKAAPRAVVRVAEKSEKPKTSAPGANKAKEKILKALKKLHPMG